MSKYKEETIQEVSEWLSKGFNSVEIAEKMNLHEVTVRNIKIELKQRNK